MAGSKFTVILYIIFYMETVHLISWYMLCITVTHSGLIFFNASSDLFCICAVHFRSECPGCDISGQ